MKSTFLYILMAALLTTACGHRANNGTNGDGDSTAVSTSFQTDDISVESEDSMASIKVSVQWPTSGNDSLVTAIRQYVCEELQTSLIQEGQPEIKYYDDGQKAVQALVDTAYNELTASWKEAKNDGIPNDMTYSCYVKISKLEETDLYITYLSNHEGFLGGAHGYATASYQTFRKRDGLRIGYQTKFNRETEQFEKQNQNLFKDPQSPELAQLIKEGVRSYFKDGEQDVATDEALKDMLIGVDDVNAIPLPSNAPSFTKQGLTFVYQQYEIAPYAAGIINFDLPLDKVLPYLTKEAAELIK
jgi:hypothetical protein